MTAYAVMAFLLLFSALHVRGGSVRRCEFAARGSVLSHALTRMTTPSAEGAKGDFASAEARRWLSDRPRHPFGPLTFELVSYPMLAGRGGSVSRRDHN